MLKDVIESILLSILTIWSLFTFVILIVASVTVLQIGEHRHIVVVYTENNNTQLQEDFKNLVEKYTKE